MTAAGMPAEMPTESQTGVTQAWATQLHRQLMHMSYITPSIEPYTHLEVSVGICVSAAGRPPHPLLAHPGANITGRQAGALPQQSLFPDWQLSDGASC